MPDQPLFAEVILPLNLKGVYTYSIPEEMRKSIMPGMRVLIPFGGRKIYTGIVAAVGDRAPEQFIPKEIISLLENFPILPPEQLQFWHWLADYYLFNVGEIYRFAFPSSLKLESETYLKLKPHTEVDFQNLDVNEMYLIQALEVRQILSLSEIEAFIPKKEIVKTINNLIDLQYIQVDEYIAEKYREREATYIRIKDPQDLRTRLPEILFQLKRSPRQQEILLNLFEKWTENPDKHIRKSAFVEEGKFSSSQIKTLIEKGLVEEYRMARDRIAQYEGEVTAAAALTAAQQQALAEMDEAFSAGSALLLHGVTASGKTHLYLEKIDEAVKNGKSVLFLLPEIALTKQISQRLEKNYGKALGFYHQKMTDFERVELWRKVRHNEVKIIIGTRSALFLPFQDLGVIVVDEEHDTAYRPREVSPYFNARDAALVLAKIYNARCILGSATPSVETFYAAKSGKMGYVRLASRYGDVALPSFEMVNFKEAQDSKQVNGSFSTRLKDEINTRLDDKNQVMILHNRRGYANVVECETCGYVAYCSNCDVVLTYHKFSNELKCHYCGQKTEKAKICPKCHSENLNTRGIGVEQIYEEAVKLFPEAAVDRMDVDSMRRKFAYEKLYQKIEDRETDIVVGTQMISKGLDFDHIELVAVPRADQLLYVQDFRAEERAYQLITQVAGRAGRVSGKGKIVIQSYKPEHPVFNLLNEKDPECIYKYFLAERRKFRYPPYVKTILIELKHRKEDKTYRAAQFMGSVISKYLPEECIFGPEKSPVGRINLLYQYQILLKLPRGKNYKRYKDLLMQSIEEFKEITAYHSVKMNLFVDF